MGPVLEASLELLDLNGLLYHVRTGTWDADIVRECSVKDCYRVRERFFRRGSEPKLIVDIGAHIGGFTKLMGAAFPDAIVFAFEPHRDNAAILAKNVAELPNVHVYRYPVMGRSCRVLVSRLEHPNTGCVRAQPIERPGQPDLAVTDGAEELVSWELATIVDACGDLMIDMLKLDCEGAEWSLLGEQADCLARVGYLAMELHLRDPLLPEPRRVEEMSELVKPYLPRIEIQKTADPALLLFYASK